jgi:hypothetical protein
VGKRVGKDVFSNKKDLGETIQFFDVIVIFQSGFEPMLPACMAGSG